MPTFEEKNADGFIYIEILEEGLVDI